MAAGAYKWTSGCYAYKSGSHKGKVYYGTSGSTEEKKEALGGVKYRPSGYDCGGAGI